MSTPDQRLVASRAHPADSFLSFQVFENYETLVIVMELIRGKELFFQILERNHYNEDDAR